MNRHLHKPLLALVLIIVSAASFYAGRQTSPQITVKLDNERVTVSESVTPQGARRETYVRPTDQLIVFLDDAKYQATDADGKTSVRERKAGEIVWHTKGEKAPLLINQGATYRNLIIALK